MTHWCRFIIQSLLLLLGPSFVAASIYMILERKFRVVSGRKHSIMRPNSLTKISIVGDVLSFLVQSSGEYNPSLPLSQQELTDTTPDHRRRNASQGPHALLRLASEQDQAHRGGSSYKVIFFVLLSSISHARMGGNLVLCATASSLPWSGYLWVLYGESLLTIVRCGFRIAEYAGRQDGVLMGTETCLYAFDVTLMVLVMVGFSGQHPRMIIGRRKWLGMGWIVCTREAWRICWSSV